MRSILLLPAFVALATSACAQTALPESEHWDFTVEPYIWLPSLAGQGQTSSSPSVEIDVIGEFDTALPLAFRADAPGERYSIFFDGLYARWRDNTGALQTKTEVSLVEGGVGVPVAEHWDLTAGLRYVEVAFDVRLGPFDEHASASFIDPWIGMRSEFPLSEEWSLLLGGDVGGFGVGSDFSWQGLALLGWQTNDRLRVGLGYRAIAVDFQENGLDYDLLAYGPILSLAWSF